MGRVGKVLRRVVATFSISLILTTVFVALQPPAVTEALNGSAFDPGNIISDSNFYDVNAMSEADIQSFLQSQIGTCSNSSCLNVLRVDTVSKAADNMCPGGYAGASAEPVSRIIYKVEKGCGISAKVILVTLQKEQGLISGSIARGPSAAVLQKAMGYGCPDTSVCDSTYYGIFNQVFQAARQLKRYGLASPDNISFHYLVVGAANSIRYSPNAQCGSGSVTIQNKATAALYYYTPYQPDAAALANLSGTGDACSAYGNRNFWVYYNTWFGPSSYPPGSPEGDLTGVSAQARSIQVTGWAVDPSIPSAALAVSVQVASNWYSTVASQPSAEALATYPAAGSAHGYTLSIPWTPGLVTVCVTIINVGAGSNVSYSCGLVNVPDYPAPVGAIETTSVSPGSVTLTGWAVRPDAPTGSVNVAAQVGTSWYQLTSGQTDAVAPTVVTGAGPAQGFTGQLALTPGQHSICIWASNTAGAGIPLVCKNVLVPAAPMPQGAIESMVGGAGTITVSGWAVRPDALGGAVNVAAQIGNSWYQLTGGKPDAVAPTVLAGAGPNQGWTGVIAATPGAKNVCIWATATSGVSIQLACRTVSVASVPSPVGGIESATAGVGTISLTGWAVRPDAPTGAVNVAAQVGNSWFQLTSGNADAVAPTKVAGAGPNQGYSGTIAVPSGKQQVCIWATSTAGTGVLLSCTTVSVTAVPSPVGAIESAVGGVGSITLSGWAVRPDSPAGSVNVAAQIGGSWYQLTSGTPDTVAPTVVAGAGPNQGFTGAIATTAGVKNVCIWVTATSGTGIQVACTTVTVR